MTLASRATSRSAADRPARIGPNAIIQTAAALQDRVGWIRAEWTLRRATGRALTDMPEAMVEEDEVNRLMRAVREDLGPALAADVLRDAGERTAEYLIAHRIPSAARRLMRILPHRVALRALLAGIMRHTWTFAGAATVEVEHGEPARLRLRHCPICRGARSAAPSCDFYAATIQRLVRRLISPAARVEESACEAMGAAACELVIFTER